MASPERNGSRRGGRGSNKNFKEVQTITALLGKSSIYVLSENMEDKKRALH